MVMLQLVQVVYVCMCCQAQVKLALQNRMLMEKPQGTHQDPPVSPNHNPCCMFYPIYNKRTALISIATNLISINGSNTGNTIYMGWEREGL